MLTVTSPAEGASFTDPNVLVTGTLTDPLSGSSSVTCNGAAASVTGPDFSCNISLAVGVNLIVVRATDIAGNVAALPLHLTLAGTLPPPTSLRITPTGVNMLVGQTQQFTAVDEQGRPRNDAAWTVSDTSLATITTDAEPVLTAVAVGQVTLTANVAGLSAQVQVNIASGTSLPPGTVRWSAPPVPGFATQKILQAVPANANTPDLYSIEADANGNSLIRAFKGEGRQMWAVPISGPIAQATPDAFGGVLLQAGFVGSPDATLIDLDGLTGAQGWQYARDPWTVSQLAVSQRGQLAVSTYDTTFSSPFVILDGRSGEQTLNVPIPQSTWIDASISCGATLTGHPNGPIGPPSFDSDGTAYVLYTVYQRTRWVCAEGQNTLSSELWLLKVFADRSTSVQSLSASNTLPVPGRVVPDGSGGLLAIWAPFPSVEVMGMGTLEPLHVTRISPSGTNTYQLPLQVLSGFGSLTDQTQLVLGESGVAFATDGSTVASFDVNSGLVNWTYQAPATSTLSIIASSAGNGLVAKLTDSNGLDTVVRLDSTGQATFDTWSAGSVQYAVGSMWLGLPALSDPLKALKAAGIDLAAATWTNPDQRGTQAGSPKIKLRVYKVAEANIDDPFIIGRIASATSYWQKRGILFDWNNQPVPVPGCASDAVRCITDTSDPLYPETQYIRNVISTSQVTEVYRRFAGSGSDPNGITVLFVNQMPCDSQGNSIEGYALPNGSGTIPAIPGRGSTLNVVVAPHFACGLLTSTPADVLDHEFGHVFQLIHVSLGNLPVMDWVPGGAAGSAVADFIIPATNLMCGPLSQDDLTFALGVACQTSRVFRYLTDDQVSRALRNARSLADVANQ